VSDQLLIRSILLTRELNSLDYQPVNIKFGRIVYLPNAIEWVDDKGTVGEDEYLEMFVYLYRPLKPNTVGRATIFVVRDQVHQSVLRS